ncbi:MAG: J domain-containing protein, partial [Hydrogenophaga sp.]|nr:J domain-containing protein [Hydrogenophaga sp.]
PACQTEYHVHWQASVCVVQQQKRVEDEPPPEDEGVESADGNMDVEEAWAVLGLQPGCGWTEVERVRRSLLQQYHPDRLGHVSPLVQKLAEGAFRRVGDAYEVLKAQR